MRKKYQAVDAMANSRLEDMYDLSGPDFTQSIPPYSTQSISPMSSTHQKFQEEIGEFASQYMCSIMNSSADKSDNIADTGGRRQMQTDADRRGQTQTDIETDRHGQTQTNTDRDGHSQTQTDSGRHGLTQTDAHGHRQTRTDTDRCRQTWTDTEGGTALVLLAPCTNTHEDQITHTRKVGGQMGGQVGGQVDNLAWVLNTRHLQSI